jgi:hypothetical protein
MRRSQRDGDRPLREPYYLQGPDLRSGENKQAEEGKNLTPESQSPDESQAAAQVAGLHGGGASAGRDAVTATSFGELARAYVPVQVYTRILPAEEGFRRGTVFPELVRTPPLYQRLD